MLKLRLLALAIAGCAALAVPAALASDAPKRVTITAQQAIDLVDALENRMVRYERIIKEDGKERLAPAFYAYDLATRKQMAVDIDRLKPLTEAIERARVAKLMELSGGTGIVKPDSKEGTLFTIQMQAETAREYTFELFVFSDTELGLEKNPFPAPLLRALKPVLVGE